MISELQEFACDEVLVDRKKIDSQDYARCLVEAAKSASYRRRSPVCATGLTLMVQRQLLKRRIENYYKYYEKFMAAVIIMKNPDCVAYEPEGMMKNDEIQLIRQVNSM